MDAVGDALIDFIYGNPTWLWGGILVVIVTVLSCLGLVAMQRLIPVELRRQHNDAAQAMISVVGTAYAVLIAFIAVAAWQTFTDADKSTGDEANFVGNLYWDTAGLPDAKVGTIRDDVKAYLDRVMHVEWPEQQKGAVAHGGQPILQRIHLQIVTIEPETPGESVIQAELLKTMNMVYSARRTRQLAAQASVPPVVWSIILLGTLLTVVYTYMLGVVNLRMHLVMTALAAVSLTMVIVLIVALDRPFRGDLSISTDAYENVLTVIDRATVADLKAH
jgi:hypothetical protein